jgi:hypothetical protein
MASFSFKTLNIISLLLALSIFGITVAAACVTWYQSSDVTNQVTSSSVVAQSNPKTVLSSITYQYSLQGITTKTVSNMKVETNVFNFYVDASARFSIVKLSQAFTLIALIVSALLAIVLTLKRSRATVPTAPPVPASSLLTLRPVPLLWLEIFRFVTLLGAPLPAGTLSWLASLSPSCSPSLSR